jgi:hypothetical protein
MSALRDFFTNVVGLTAAAGPKPSASGKSAGSKPERRDRIKEYSDKKIDEIIGDPQERLEEMAKWDVPRFSDLYKDDTPETQFLDDMASGSKKANEYVKFINEQLKYVEDYGNLVGLDRIPTAAKGLKKITGKLSGGLGKAGKAIQRVKQIVEWVRAMDKFADDTVAMDPKDRKSVERWVGSMQRLWNATTPFLEWIQNKAAVAAIAEGSEAAAALSATLAIVGSELFIGIKALEAGVKVVNAYLDRYDRIMKEIDRESGTAEAPPPPPEYPGDDWKSREDQARDAVALENSQLRSKIVEARQQEIRREQEAREEASEKAKHDFDTIAFPPIYIKHRPEIRSKIKAALGKGGDKPIEIGPEYSEQMSQGHGGINLVITEDRWWDCLMVGNGPDEEIGGRYYASTKDSVSTTDALEEIRRFHDLKDEGVKPCPYFDSLCDGEFKKHLASAK